MMLLLSPNYPYAAYFSSVLPQRRQTRSLLPSGSTLWPSRVPLLQAGQNSRTFEMAIGPSFSTMALHVLGRIGTRVALDDSRVLNRNGALGRIHGQHTSGFAAIAPGHDPHLVALLQSRSG
jgi:hypothetical protein